MQDEEICDGLLLSSVCKLNESHKIVQYLNTTNAVWKISTTAN